MPTVVCLATVSLTVLLPGQGSLTAGRQTFTCCFAVLMLQSLLMKNSSYCLPSLETVYSQLLCK